LLVELSKRRILYLRLDVGVHFDSVSHLELDIAYVQLLLQSSYKVHIVRVQITCRLGGSERLSKVVTTLLKVDVTEISTSRTEQQIPNYLSEVARSFRA